MVGGNNEFVIFFATIIWHVDSYVPHSLYGSILWEAHEKVAEGDSTKVFRGRPIIYYNFQKEDNIQKRCPHLHANYDKKLH